MKHTLVIVGAGLAGLSAALTAVKNGWTVKLVSSLASERAQSVMAEETSFTLHPFSAACKAAESPASPAPIIIIVLLIDIATQYNIK